jgi:chemotaxis protein histidine kinase CheA
MNEAQGIGQSQENLSQPAVTQNVSQPESSPVTDERTFRQSEVNDIVKKAKHGAVEDYRRLHAEQPQYAREKYGESLNGRASQDFSPSMSETDYRRLAAEEAERLRDQWVQDARSKAEADNAQRIVQNFWSKISQGKDKYDDFDKVVGDIDYSKFSNVVHLLADHVDNAHDVLYELGKNRMNLAGLEQLAYMSPKDAIVQAQRLSQSLKDNEGAKNTRVPNEPLSQMRPSNTGTDNGVMSVGDFRKKYRV